MAYGNDDKYSFIHYKDASARGKTQKHPHPCAQFFAYGEPVEDISHVASNAAKLWHTANKTGSRTEDAVQTI